MTDTYRYLRRVEHFLQMLNDEQTQKLPEDEDELAEFAVFLGYADSGAFAVEFLETLNCVETHYAKLFEDAPSLGAEGTAAGNLVFTGPDADPDTIRTIASLGYENPETVDGAVRGWHHGRYRAMRSTRAREMLTELTPRLLAALAKTPLPDDTFVRFDRFLAGLPAGVQLFAMFHSRPELLDLVAEVIGTAPRLAEHLSHNRAVLESVLSADFFDPPPPPALLEKELDLLLGRARDFEDILNDCRRWANDRKFQVGVHSLGRRLAPRNGATALSNIADVVLGLLSSRVENEFASQHGHVAGAGMLMVALGKLGGSEMTPSSDLDVIFVYDAPGDVDTSDGPAPLPPAQYFARLSQRLINAVTAPTSEGRLYEVDMRLRPSGSIGPIASSLQAFVRYHEDAAWAWEHMALTRARCIVGPPDLKSQVEKVIRDTLTRRRDADKLLGDVAGMRQRMDDEHHTDVVWDVKHVRGGLVDVEFIAQYLQLRHAHGNSEILSPATRTALINLGDAGLLDAADAGHLIEALDLWQSLQGMLRLTLEGQARSADADDIPAGLRDILAAVGGAADFTALIKKMRTVAERTHGIYDTLIAAPAAKLGGAEEQKEGGGRE
jgi:glutamate-ammonia-ligase adenylyltransferase